MKKILMPIALVLAVSLAIAVNAMAGEFAADFKQYLSWEAKKQKSGQIFVKSSKYRMEFTQGDIVTEVIIVNPDKKAVWLLDPTKKTYTELNYREKPWHVSRFAEAKFEITKEINMGNETINGYSCEKISYSYDDTTLGKTTVWLSDKLEYPVKWENKGQQGTAWFQISKISDGKFKDTLFALPKGYSEMSAKAEDKDTKSAKDSEAAKIVKDEAKDLAGDAHSAAKQEVSSAITDSVREGVRGILGK